MQVVAVGLAASRAAAIGRWQTTQIPYPPSFSLSSAWSSSASRCCAPVSKAAVR